MKPIITFLCLLLAGALFAQIPPMPQTNGPAQIYHDTQFGTMTVQPMICNGRPYGELFLSNSLGIYMKHDKAVTNALGQVLGYEIDSFLPPPKRTRITTLTWTNDFEFSTDLIHWTNYPVFFVRRANINSTNQ